RERSFRQRDLDPVVERARKRRVGEHQIEEQVLAALDLAHALHVALARGARIERHRQRHEDVAERAHRVERTRDIVRGDEDVDVLRRSGSAVSCHRDTAAHGIANAGCRERGRDRMKLVDEIHPICIVPRNYCVGRGPIGAAGGRSGFQMFVCWYCDVSISVKPTNSDAARNALTNTTVWNSRSYLRCMKNKITSDALTTAIAIAMPRLIGAPKSIRVASTVTSVRNSSVPPVAHSTLIVATWASP